MENMFQVASLFNIDTEVYITFYNLLYFYNIINFFKIIIGIIEITSRVDDVYPLFSP